MPASVAPTVAAGQIWRQSRPFASRALAGQPHPGPASGLSQLAAARAGHVASATEQMIHGRRAITPTPPCGWRRVLAWTPVSGYCGRIGIIYAARRQLAGKPLRPDGPLRLNTSLSVPRLAEVFSVAWPGGLSVAHKTQRSDPGLRASFEPCQ